MNNSQEIENLQKAIAALGATIGKIIHDSVEKVLFEKEHLHNPTKAPEIFSTGRILTKRQTAKLLNITPRTVDEWMKRGLLPYLKIGRTVRFKEDDLMQHLSDYALVGRARMNR